MKSGEITRRQLSGIAGAALLLKTTARTAAAQTPPSSGPPSSGAPDWYRQTLDSKRAAAAELARFELTLSDFGAIEPAFRFKA